MLYLKNSLVNLTIILFSLFFLTTLLAENNEFIFPQKKVITIKVDEKKQENIRTNKNLKSTELPQRNPLRKDFSIQEDLKKKIKTSALKEKKFVIDKAINNNLPQKKPTLNNNVKTEKVTKPFLENKTQKIIEEVKKKKKVEKN